jgi:S-adenosyl-L-methionine hydrolase (adenosine-forming)
VDTFGNVQLTITAADATNIGLKPGGTVMVTSGRQQLTLPFRETFGMVALGDLVVHTDGAGLVSIAVNGGNAAQRLGLPPGARVSISPSPHTIQS